MRKVSERGRCGANGGQAGANGGQAGPNRHGAAPVPASKPRYRDQPQHKQNSTHRHEHVTGQRQPRGVLDTADELNALDAAPQVHAEGSRRKKGPPARAVAEARRDLASLVAASAPLRWYVVMNPLLCEGELARTFPVSR